jgi:hypothetical protein
MTPEEISCLRALSDAATPGPWPVAVWIETDGNEWRATGPGHDNSADDAEPGCPDEQAAQRDAVFIAASRSALPALLDEVERLRDDLAAIVNGPLHASIQTTLALRAALTEACDGWQRYVRGHGASSDDDDIARLRKLAVAVTP